MNNVRIIARLDIKGPNLIKGVHLEGLRVIGSANEHAYRYYQHGIDELIYMDVVASLYGRNNLTDIVEKTIKDIFVPLTVGGGIRSVEDAKRILRSGADKVAINTAAVSRPSLISEIAESFGVIDAVPVAHDPFLADPGMSEVSSTIDVVVALIAAVTSMSPFVLARLIAFNIAVATSAVVPILLQPTR